MADPAPDRAIPDHVPHLPAEELDTALEAVCFALNRSLTLADAAAVLGRAAEDVAVAAETLAIRLRGRGLMLQRHQDEVQLVTRPEVAWAVQRALNPERPGRLSRPALETLAIVAYRQPLTRAGVEAIRGVNCEAVLDSLERRGLVAEVGRQDSPGHPRLFGTTLRFLEVVGLERVEDLPPLPDGTVIPELPAERWETPGAGDGEADGEAGGTTDEAGPGEPVAPAEDRAQGHGAEAAIARAHGEGPVHAEEAAAVARGPVPPEPAASPVGAGPPQGEPSQHGVPPGGPGEGAPA
jgi:segregation and condensation protein B